MPKKKLYINLPEDKKKYYGRVYPIKIAASETRPGASEGRLFYLFLEEGPKNVPKTMLSAGERAGGFKFTPPNRKLCVITKKKQEVDVKLSIGGGDLFKIKYGKNADGSGSKQSGLEIECWRKIFVRYGKMKSCPDATWGTIKSEFEKLFIEVETEGPTEIPRESWVRDQSPVTRMDRGKAAMPFPDQSTKLVFVDRIGRKSTATGGPWEWTPAQLNGSKVYEWTIPNSKYTWTDDLDWITGEIKVIEADGRERRLSVPMDSVVTKKAAGAFDHPEGKAATKIQMDFSRLPGLTPWIRRGTGKLSVKLDIGIMDDLAMGLAWPSPPQILIATHDPYTYAAGGYLENTTVHEIGHNLGLNVYWLPEWVPDTGAFDDWVANTTWYNNVNGGVGPHCNTGASLDAQNHYKNGTCTMLHYVNGKTAFCAQCATILKRSDLKKLGMKNVWPNG